MSEQAGAPAAAPITSTSQPTGSGGEPSSTQSNSPGLSTSGDNSKPSSVVPATPPETREYKINGKVVKMTQKEADDYVSMSYAAQEKFNEAAKIRKESDARKESYKKNRIQAFIDATEDMSPEQRREVLEEFYAKQYIEPESMSPQERALAEREQKIQLKEKEYQAQEAKAQKEYLDNLTNTHREQLQKQIVEYMEESGLPKSKFIVGRLAFYMRQNAMNGWEAPKDMLIKQVKAERKSIVADMTEDSSAEQLIDMLGENVVKKINKHYLEQLRSGRGKLAESFTGSGESVPASSGQKIDYSEVNKRLREMRNGTFKG